MADEDSDDAPPPRPSIPRRRREGVVIEATLSSARRSPRRRLVFAAALGAVLGAALMLAGVRWARGEPARLKAPPRSSAAIGAVRDAPLAGLAKWRKVGESHAAEAARAAEGWMEEAAARLAADETVDELTLRAAPDAGDARR